ncbi:MULTISPECIES: PP2C family protein-serine/threonine phosphatase [unclassified Streptomyces]|uniref:PP2C family protein-serine/threonine phosphatase n=1 Tax=unclassified Streptomyces TaxID=2593676 RepID=UPI002DD8E474|nr:MULTISPECIES: SpoIIE family protein phosphatase [unclassified Streptomyces]WSC50329.1 SpoIIE family protein phosphatase [Streptomyces sp. NBC_01762]WSC59166.1 SpoIIE family protein phosphatase [Streptomyces sp. NBC_01761]WSF90298.1 SpoIIE family protein phosphatase [Streptomyces sp. NBC_01744]WSJ56488.1 SpoIIE family protein phosphatase [Streptomyces sp. NBC_01318]
MGKSGDEEEGRGLEGDRKPVGGEAQFSALLEDSAEDLYEHAPCGYLSTLLDGQIAKVNTTLLDWLGYERGDLVGRKHFSDLLSVGGRLYHETHYAPLLRMQGEISGIALELKAADGSRLPVLVTSTVKTGSDGQPLLIRTTVFDARDRRAYETELLRARQEAEREREHLKRLNATLQKTLLPPALANVPGLNVAAHYHIASADEVGGDFYDLFPLAAGTWGLFLGDVCGKGAAAAAVTSLARYTLRAAAVYDPDPAAVLGNLNTVLNHEYSGTDPRFCTVIFGLLTPYGDQGGFRVTLASGGHPSALLMRADGTADYLPTPGGQLIGVLPDAHIATTTIRLNPGDTLLLHTDGLTEAHTASTGATDRYGDEALLDFARTLAPTTATDTIVAIRDLLDTFGTGVDDDTAVLAINVPRPTSEEQQ